jgi:hypothetical protein
MNLKKIATLVVLSIFLFSCASAPEKITNTVTGKPEIIINTLDVTNIKGQIISDMLIDGYMVIQETPHLLELQRATKGNEDLAAYFMSVGNSYSTNYRVVAINFIKSKDSTRIVATNFMKSNMALGQVNKSVINNNKLFNIWQEYLYELKDKIEGK